MDIDTYIKNASDLLQQKRKISQDLLDSWNSLDNKLKKSENCNACDYIKSLNGSVEEDISKINSVCKGMFSGLNSTQRQILLELYLLQKGKLRHDTSRGLVNQLHETILGLMSICIYSRSSLNGRFYGLRENMDKYSSALRDADRLLSMCQKESLYRELSNLDNIDSHIMHEVYRIMGLPDTKGFFEHTLAKYSSSLKKAATYGLVILMLSSSTYANAYASEPPASDATTAMASSNSAVASSTFKPIFPTSTGYIITSLYGQRVRNYKLGKHEGIDIACPIGTAIKSAAAGIVTIKNEPSGYGLYVIVDHGNGFQTLYAHLSKVKCKNKQRIAAGEVIAYSGKSGRGESAHLHYELSINGQKVDPLIVHEPALVRSLNLKLETIPKVQAEAYSRFKDLASRAAPLDSSQVNVSITK